MIRNFLLAVTFVLTANFAFAETSVFDAGNMDLSKPYGLTPSEQVALKNRQTVENVEAKLNTIFEQLDGLRSVVEGMSAKNARLEQRLKSLEDRLQGDSNSTNAELDDMRKHIQTLQKNQEQNYAKITKTLKDLNKLFQKGLKASSSEPTDKFKSMKNADILSEGLKLFNSGKITQAAENFEYLLSKNYKPATMNFYLGEVAYKQKSYSSAIKFYQKSIEIYDKAKYTPKLLYHTAISFDKVGDTKSANRFYKALKLGYPDTPEAKASPTRE